MSGGVLPLGPGDVVMLATGAGPEMTVLQMKADDDGRMVALCYRLSDHDVHRGKFPSGTLMRVSVREQDTPLHREGWVCRVVGDPQHYRTWVTAGVGPHGGQMCFSANDSGFMEAEFPPASLLEVPRWAHTTAPNPLGGGQGFADVAGHVMARDCVAWRDGWPRGRYLRWCNVEMRLLLRQQDHGRLSAWHPHEVDVDALDWHLEETVDRMVESGWHSWRERSGE